MIMPVTHGPTPLRKALKYLFFANFSKAISEWMTMTTEGSITAAAYASVQSDPGGGQLVLGACAYASADKSIELIPHKQIVQIFMRRAALFLRGFGSVSLSPAFST